MKATSLERVPKAEEEKPPYIKWFREIGIQDQFRVEGPAYQHNQGRDAPSGRTGIRVPFDQDRVPVGS